MDRMHELMMSGNPGMQRMQELSGSGNPGMQRMHEVNSASNDVDGPPRQRTAPSSTCELA